MMVENPYQSPQTNPLPPVNKHFTPLMDRDPKRMPLRKAAAVILLLLFGCFAIAWFGARLYEAIAR
jgi:hypothetical protein